MRMTEFVTVNKKHSYCNHCVQEMCQNEATCLNSEIKLAEVEMDE
jgi:hypothetical protein